jgi:hypothetical protein
MNSIKNNPVTTEDIEIAEKIFGPDIPSLKGKTTCRKPNRNLSTSGLDSGSSWLDGVNGILMQQEPNLPKAGLLESKGYCFPCQHLNHSRGASSKAFTVFYAAATALEMPV